MAESKIEFERENLLGAVTHLAKENEQLRGNLSLAEEGLANYQQELDAIKRTREQERDYADVCYENERLSTLLGMVAVHLEHPELGGLGEEQLLAISEWYETFRENRGGVPQSERIGEKHE